MTPDGVDFSFLLLAFHLKVPPLACLLLMMQVD